MENSGSYTEAVCSCCYNVADREYTYYECPHCGSDEFMEVDNRMDEVYAK